MNDEVVEEVKKHLKETSVENKEFTLQFKELNIKFPPYSCIKKAP